MSRITIIQLWLCLLCLFPRHAVSQTLEYWFDDHYDQRGTTSIATSNAEQELSLDLRDNTKFPYGFHKLNMRVIIVGKPSSVYSSNVLKLAAGKASHLEYWVENEMSKGNIKTIDGVISEDGITYNFLESLNLADVSPGYHKLYYRAVSNSRRTTSAIGSTPILVKSKYNVENPEALTVTKQAYWFDDEEPEVTFVSRPKNDIVQPYTFDTRKLPDGKHTLYLQYGNSAGIWNGPVSTTFTKVKVEDPNITANASVEDGILTLNFNSVPSGYVYSIIRQYPSGSIRKIKDIQSTEYPATLKFTDTPAPGNYTYYVEGRYTDADGARQKVRSKDVSVTVEKAASSIKRGTIHGAIILNGGKDHIPAYMNYNILVNGQAGNTEYTMEKGDYGTFMIKDIPYGTEISIGIEHRSYNFKEITIIVNENTVNSTYKFNGTEEEIENDNLQPNINQYDLGISSTVHITPSAWELEVYNKYRNRSWSGNIILKVIKKEVKDYYDNADDPSFWKFVINKNAVPVSENVYTTVADMPVKFDKSEFKTLRLDIIALPNGDELEDYYVYVFSKKEGSDQMKELDDGDFKSYRNPQVLNFNPSDFSTAQVNDYKSLIEDYKTILRHLKKMKEWGDPFALEINTFGNSFDSFINNLGNKTLDLDGFEKDLIVNTSQATGMLLKCFLNDVHKEVKQVAKSTNNSLSVANGIIKVYDTLNAFYAANSVDDNYKFFETAKQVMKLCETLKLSEYPALNIYKNYLEVGKAMVDAIDRITNVTRAHEIYNRLFTGKGVYKIKVRKYPDPKRGTEYFNGWQFYQQYKNSLPHPGEIKSISIELIDPTYKSNRVKSNPINDDNLEFANDGITIKNVSFPNDMRGFTDVEAWMIITWNNHRVTHVPLLDEHFVKIENKRANEDVPLIMTVELQSETYMHMESIANKLTIVKRK